jgi:N-dimethylarginine dimethylaminohydrolase
MYGYCPRDTHLIIGDNVIEAPMSYRSRQMEADVLSHVRQDAIAHGANWISAPRPILPVGTHYVSLDNKVTLLENEPIFDAANCLRLNDDILYLKSCTGNVRGADWLQRYLGKNYRVHVLDDIYAYAHIDSTIAPIREGLVVLNRSRVKLENMPAIFSEQKWDVIWFEDPVPISFYKYPYASAWIGMNLLMIDPKTAIVDKNQTHLIKQLEQNQIEVWALELRHARTLGGGFHCVTLDLHRE